MSGRRAGQQLTDEKRVRAAPIFLIRSDESVRLPDNWPGTGQPFSAWRRVTPRSLVLALRFRRAARDML